MAPLQTSHASQEVGDWTVDLQRSRAPEKMRLVPPFGQIDPENINLVDGQCTACASGTQSVLMGVCGVVACDRC